MLQLFKLLDTDFKMNMLVMEIKHYAKNVGENWKL
jgi:hypothetical protein